MADYGYVNFNKFRPTKYPNWGYQKGNRIEAIVYYPTGEVWELAQLVGWHDDASYDIIVFLDADALSEQIVAEYMFGAGIATIEEAIEYFNDQLGYDLGEEE